MAKKPTKRQRLVDELASLGVTRNEKGPCSKEPVAVLEGMLAKARADHAAREAGAGPCPEHPGQVEGVCPICRGIWAQPGEPEFEEEEIEHDDSDD